MKQMPTIRVKEAAMRLGVSEMTVYRMLKAGKFNAFKRLVNRHWQSFILMDEKWKNQISKKYISVYEAFDEIKKSFEPSAKEHNTALLESYEKAAKEHSSAAATASMRAEDHATNAENQAIECRKFADTAKNASEYAERCYNSARATMEDTAKYLGRAHVSASKAKEEAQSAMYCVIWCTVGVVISFAAAIISIIH